MDYIQMFFSLVFIFLISIIFFYTRSKQRLKFPPSPADSKPLLGHLHLIERPFHRKLSYLSQSLGNPSVFHLLLGYRNVYVVSSRTIAQECFTENDLVLANRPVLSINKHLGYNSTTMSGASYGDHLRNLRRILTTEISPSPRLSTIRKDEIRRLILRLSRDSLHEFVEVELKSLFTNLVYNNIMRLIAGKSYYGDDIVEDEDEDETKTARKLISEAVAAGSEISIADFLPVSDWFSDFEEQIQDLGHRSDAFFQKQIDEKRAKKEKSETMISNLLSRQETQPEQYSDVIIKGTIFDMLGGTENTAITLEWALSNLLNHPEILNKLRTEIDDKIGLDRLVDESDIVNLPYLRNVILETFRLYPPAPLLFPHLSSEECKVGGYDMPRGTTLLINVWAMHRDPELWEEVDQFKPERFDKEGESQKLMTFGLGRRACPGYGLAHRILSLTLGSLIQCFDWKRVGLEEIEMCEGSGNTMPKEKPLRAMCKTRFLPK